MDISPCSGPAELQNLLPHSEFSFAETDADDMVNLVTWLNQTAHPHSVQSLPLSFQNLTLKLLQRIPRQNSSASDAASPAQLHTLAAQNLRLGQFHLQQDNPSQAFFHGSHALGLARRAGDALAEAAAHLLLGAMMTRLGDADKARHCATAAEQALMGQIPG